MLNTNFGGQDKMDNSVLNIQYIERLFNGKSRSSLNKLNKAVNDNKFESKSFEDCSIDFTSFDWTSIEMDRNWWWQIQALPFLEWFVQSHKLMNKSVANNLIEYCLNCIACWESVDESNVDSPLRWHDHATSFRLTNLVFFYHILQAYYRLSQKVSIKLQILIERHLDWLSEEENFSKHTNHGFDQATSAYICYLMSPKQKWRKWGMIGKKRLIEELDFAFTQEGVHKENSPGYHVFMLRRIKELPLLSMLKDKEVSMQASLIIEGAEGFLEAITMPDGYLPIVGDTRGYHKGVSRELPEKPHIYDFSRSGYVVVKGKVLEKPFYFLVKNSHSSRYHRHDDDLMIYLWFDGHTLLGDAGLGDHNEETENRKFVRSPFAHNLPIISGTRARRKPESVPNKPTMRVEGNKIIASSSMFGETLQRVVDLTDLTSGKFSVSDFSEKASLKILTNIFSPCEIFQEKDGVSIGADSVKLNIKVSSSKNEAIEWEFKERVQSLEFGKYVTAYSAQSNFVKHGMTAAYSISNMS